MYEKKSRVIGTVVVAMVSGVLAAGMLVGCKKGVESSIPTPAPTIAAPVVSQPAMPPQQGQEVPMRPPTGMGGDQAGMPPQGMPQAPQQERQVVVPAEVTKRWKAIHLVVKEKKEGGSVQEFDAPFNSEVAVSGSALKIRVGDMLPDFSMDGAVITSKSADPNMPAVFIEIAEGKDKIFQGWIFAKMPEVHAFTHEKYQVVFSGPVAR